MKNNYNKMMDTIEVTPEMHDRIIKNIEDADLYIAQRKIINLSRYRKYIYIAASLMFLVVSLVLIQDIINSRLDPITEMPGPVGLNISEFSSIQDLSKRVGFNVQGINKIPFIVNDETYTAFGKELAQIRYANKEASIVFRKSIGNEDNSGDYNEYNTVKELVFNKLKIIVKGNSGSYNLAIWEKDGFSYSLNCSEGITEAEILEMVESLE